jgi:uroporphyrinogen decarboxylase
MTNDFRELERVFNREPSTRPVLFEFFMNDGFYRRVTGAAGSVDDRHGFIRRQMLCYVKLGYDYVMMHGSDISFPTKSHGNGQEHKSYSLNTGSVIASESDYEAYPWPDPFARNESEFLFAAEQLPPDMKLIIYGPCGVLENAIALVGYDNLCFMLYEEPELAGKIINKIGETLYRYYEKYAPHPRVGALMLNDDWGFNTQTMLAPEHMRKYIFPWHEAIVDIAHRHKKYALLHSCGYAEEIMEDVIAMGFDARHSYEDNIMPVEDFYEKYHKRIAILGGMDLNFVCTATPEEVTARSRAMLARTKARGGWALGTSNSIPDYVPDKNFFAMLEAAKA